MSLLIDLLEFFARLLRASDDGTQRGDSGSRSLVQASAVGDEDIEGWLWGSLQSYLPILFGLLGAPLLMAVHELWLAPWSDFGSETDVLALFLWVAPVGLAFWYLAGLLWRGATGCAGPAFGILLLFVASIFIASDAGWGVITEVLAGAVLAAVLGIVAYPFGVLGRVLFGRGPLLGVAWGALLLAICGIGIVSAPAPGDFWTIGLATWFAPACLVAGMGTLLLVVPMVQRQGDTTTIGDEEARPLSDLIAALRLEASAKALEEAGLIARCAGTDREVRYRLTVEGEGVARRKGLSRGSDGAMLINALLGQGRGRRPRRRSVDARRWLGRTGRHDVS